MERKEYSSVKGEPGSLVLGGDRKGTAEAGRRIMPSVKNGADQIPDNRIV